MINNGCYGRYETLMDVDGIRVIIIHDGWYWLRMLKQWLVILNVGYEASKIVIGTVLSWSMMVR